MKKKLILHVGHGKTGTSYIQSTLALNFEKLRENGIFYPKNSSFKNAIKGITTSGNGSLIFNKNFNVKGKTLLSDEGLCYRLTVDNNFEKFVLRHKSELEVILYTRNVIEFFASSWGQYLKVGLGTLDFEEFILENKNPYDSVLWWLKAAKKYKFVCKVKNYSNHKKSLIDSFTKDLFGYDLNFEFKLPDPKLINRSLTLSERQVLRAFNQFLGLDASFISDNLVNKIPNIEVKYPRISKKSYDFLNNQISPCIKEINTLIDPKEVIHIENYQVYNSQKNIAKDDICKLTQNQLQAIAESVYNELTFKNLARKKLKKYNEKVKLKFKDFLKIYRTNLK